jgi:hypothetical protein
VRRTAFARGVALAALAVLVACVIGPDAGGPRGSRTSDPRRGPAQPVAFAYGDELTGLDAYARPGALVVAGRENQDADGFRRVVTAGGSVLVYLDAVVRNPFGRYHSLLFDASACGPAVPVWPGLPPTRYGPLADLRPGGVLQGKLGCVLEAMVVENPTMAGWFADDLGSRSSLDPAALSPADRRAYRDGAVALSATFRAVADRHGLLVLVNGAWEGGAVDEVGGGYPDPARSGNALADGGVVENHDDQVRFFGPYLCSLQWASESPVTRGRPFQTVITSTPSAREDYLNTGCVAYATTQTDYGVVPAPWGPFASSGPVGGALR